MNRWLIILILPIIVGCTSPRQKVYVFDSDKVIWIPPGTTLEWNDMPLKDKSKKSGVDVKIIDDIIIGDVRVTKDWGYFIAEDILKEVDRIDVEEDVGMTLGDWVWKKVLGIK